MKITKQFRDVVVGLIIAAMLIGFVYYAKSKTLREGLTSNAANSEFISKGIKNDIESLKDSLHIAKYKGNYQEILKDLATWCDLEILNTIAKNKLDMSNGFNTQNTEILTSLNQWSEFKNTLQSVHDNVLSNTVQ